MKQRWRLDRNVLRPTPGDPRGAEQHHWNTGAKENQQLNPGESKFCEIWAKDFQATTLILLELRILTFFFFNFNLLASAWDPKRRFDQSG